MLVSKSEHMYLKGNGSDKDKWLRVLVSAKQLTGGSQDHLVCLHLLPILTDQSHISKVKHALTLSTVRISVVGEILFFLSETRKSTPLPVCDFPWVNGNYSKFMCQKISLPGLCHRPLT